MNSVREALSYVDGLSESLSHTAEWRREKVEQFPDDDRNLKAAVLLEELAKQMKALSGGELDRQLGSLWKACKYGDTLITAQSELLRAVGFHWEGNATHFVEELISLFEREGNL